MTDQYQPTSSEYLGPYRLNSIITGDAKELAKEIPDESIDLVFTDPIYSRIDDYRWLAETAARVLKPGGNLVAFTASSRQIDVSNIFRDRGLVWCDILVLRETARRRFNHGRKIVVLLEVAVWGSKGKHRLGKYVNNFSFVSNGYTKSDTNHDWNKVADGITHWIERLSEPTGIILDPFTGGGTVPAVCKMLGRNYLAFEIEPGTADLARRRVAETQPPLPLQPQPTQGELL